jgi:hypothetical protein
MTMSDRRATDAAGDGAEKTSVEASQGAKTGRVRWVLVISLSLGVIALGAAFIGYTAWQQHADAPASTQAATSQPSQSGS